MKNEQNQHKHMFFNDLPETIVVELDKEKNFTFLNKTAFTLTGYNSWDISDLKTEEIFDGDIEKIREAFQKVISGYREIYLKNCHLVKKNGEKMTVKMHLIPLVEEGLISGARVIIHDISELEKWKNKAIQYRENLNLLVNTTKDLVNGSLDEILLKIAQITKKLIRLDRCSVWLYYTEEDKFKTIVAQGLNGKQLEMNSDQGIVSLVFSKGFTHVFNSREELLATSEFNPKIDEETGYTTETMIATPMVDRHTSKIIGVLQGLNKEKLPFSIEDEEFFSHLAQYTAELISANLHADREKEVKHNLEKALKELERINLDVIKRLANMSRFRDKETQTHNKRVGLIAQKLGESFLSSEEIKNIVLAASLHDIGKVGVADSILLKAGSLTAEERKEMQKHCQVGFDILQGSNTNFLKMAAQIALDHHERWNGKGYPNGKKEKEISIYGQLVAVADVFDALTSQRPYKKPWKYEDAKTEIIKQAGEQFNPEIIEIFIEKFDEIAEIRKKYQDKENTS